MILKSFSKIKNILKAYKLLKRLNFILYLKLEETLKTKN